MLQNKLLINQSSVRLEIFGLPDYSNNEDKDHISIISQWKLMIIDKPLIEGNLDHLKSIMDAFYTYSTSLLNDEIASYESNLIDIEPENYFTHVILLKSSKPDVKPLNFKIGNSVLSDIINCFDQLGSSNKVKNIYNNEFYISEKKGYLKLFDKTMISNFLLPPLISICSIFLVSTALIFFYNSSESDDNRSFIDTKNRLVSIKSTKAII